MVLIISELLVIIATIYFKNIWVLLVGLPLLVVFFSCTEYGRRQVMNMMPYGNDNIDNDYD